MQIENEISIKPLDKNYIDSIHKYLNNEKLAETYPIDLPYTKENVLTYIEREIQQKGKGIRFAFAIQFNNQFAGICALYNVDKNKREAGIYYWVAVQYWNKGLASRTLKRIISYAKNELGLKKLRTGVLKRNIASIKVLEKNGFIKAGNAKDPTSYHNKFSGEEVLEMLLKLDVNEIEE